VYLDRGRLMELGLPDHPVTLVNTRPDLLDQLVDAGLVLYAERQDDVISIDAQGLVVQPASSLALGVDPDHLATVTPLRTRT
jgi:hypothetical protein